MTFHEPSFFLGIGVGALVMGMGFVFGYRRAKLGIPLWKWTS